MGDAQFFEINKKIYISTTHTQWATFEIGAIEKS